MVEFIPILVTVIIFVLSSLPLYLSANLLGGQASLLKTVLVALIAGIIVSVIESFFTIWGGLVAFIVLIYIYRGMFDVGWGRAFLIWLIQLVIIVIFHIIARIIGLTIMVF